MRDDGFGSAVPGSADGFVDRSLLDAVERHWRALAPAGALPRRRDLDARAVGAALPQAFTLEEVAPGVARVRTAGQRLHDWFGADPRGVPLSALFDEEGRVALREALAAAFGEPALVELTLATPRGPLRSPIAGRLLLLPLQGEDGSVTRAIGAVGLDRAPPPGPRRFTVPASGACRIESLHATLPPRPRPSLGAPPRPERLMALAPGMAERQRPFLRLVVSND